MKPRTRACAICGETSAILGLCWPCWIVLIDSAEGARMRCALDDWVRRVRAERTSAAPTSAGYRPPDPEE